MTIEWNRVTWYSKLLAVVVFVATFVIAFNLGVLWEQANLETAIIETLAPSDTDTGAPVVGAGEHCGGFIRNAPTCAAGYHCQLKVNMPDTGGTCVKD